MATPIEEAGPPADASTPRRPRSLEIVGWIAGGLVVIVLATLLLSRISTAATQVKVATSQTHNASNAVPQGALGISLVGRTAPDIVFSAWAAKSGQQVSLASLRGHPVVLNFWESTCYPCQLEAPLFVQANKTYAPKGVIFVGVALYTSQADGEAFLKQEGLTYLAGGATTNQTVVDYGLIGVPDTYFINSAGQIVDQNVGQITQQKLSEGITKALG